MQQWFLTRLLLSPSLLSGISAAGIATATVGYEAWTYLNNSQLFYDYISGPYGLKTYFWQHSEQATSTRDAFLGSSLTYYILVVVVAIAAGLIVGTVLQAADTLFSGIRRTLRELDPSEATRKPAAARELLRRLGLRLITLAGWTVYSLFFFSTLLLFVTLLNEAGLDRIHAGRLIGWLECTGAAIMLALALHIHVVFARLLLLRPRLFFGEQAVIAAEARKVRLS